MSLDNKIKEQLRDYKIQPTSKPWDRIEEALDAKHKPKSWVVYVRWAAAASLFLMVASYPFWNGSNINSDFVNTNSNVEQKQNTNDIKEAKNIKNNPFVEVSTEEKINENVIENSIKPIPLKANNQESNPIAQSSESKKNEQLNNNENISKRPIEEEVATINNKILTIDFQHNIPNLKLPEFSTEMTETASNYIKWKKFFIEDLNEESDSTLTERALNLANKKSVAFVKNNWKPAVAKWVKLKKGF